MTINEREMDNLPTHVVACAARYRALTDGIERNGKLIFWLLGAFLTGQAATIALLAKLAFAP